jgi:hypothetical protein
MVDVDIKLTKDGSIGKAARKLLQISSDAEVRYQASEGSKKSIIW